MKEIVEVFRMEEVSKETRAKIIIHLGRIINHQFGGNLTEGLVFELVSILHPENPILKNEHYIKMSQQ